MPKTRIKIEFGKKEDAILYAEKTLGRNKTIQKEPQCSTMPDKEQTALAI